MPVRVDFVCLGLYFPHLSVFLFYTWRSGLSSVEIKSTHFSRDRMVRRQWVKFMCELYLQGIVNNILWENFYNPVYLSLTQTLGVEVQKQTIHSGYSSHFAVWYFFNLTNKLPTQAWKRNRKQPLKLSSTDIQMNYCQGGFTSKPVKYETWSFFLLLDFFSLK